MSTQGARRPGEFVMFAKSEKAGTLLVAAMLASWSILHVDASTRALAEFDLQELMSVDVVVTSAAKRLKQ